MTRSRVTRQKYAGNSRNFKRMGGPLVTLYHIFLLLSPGSQLPSPASCLPPPASRLPSPISCLSSLVSLLPSLISLLQSLFSRLSSLFFSLSSLFFSLSSLFFSLSSPVSLLSSSDNTGKNVKKHTTVTPDTSIKQHDAVTCQQKYYACPAVELCIL